MNLYYFVKICLQKTFIENCNRKTTFLKRVINCKSFVEMYKMGIETLQTKNKNFTKKKKIVLEKVLF